MLKSLLVPFITLAAIVSVGKVEAIDPVVNIVSPFPEMDISLSFKNSTMKLDIATSLDFSKLGGTEVDFVIPETISPGLYQVEYTDLDHKVSFPIPVHIVEAGQGANLAGGNAAAANTASATIAFTVTTVGNTVPSEVASVISSAKTVETASPEPTNAADAIIAAANEAVKKGLNSAPGVSVTSLTVNVAIFFSMVLAYILA
ncbi:hypothetical protein BDF20DRAFT_831087 [Mycotypha africana]|uniref:uncharacterized protein n=1 Tax=Mycotypha africana TaxID=64632 RepID=UPI002300E377|nr:uncharacterized protein BDF20DRAFT_831087 [Mycotypha africana]KAI8990998.1 hypothetical protein BDF20DRAFT_831087 [Mycotypha africana]